MIGDTSTTQVWHRAVGAELSWLGADGLSSIPIVPLTHRGRFCAALPYHRIQEVASLSDGTLATWTVTDPRTRGGHGVAVRGPVSVLDDVDGEVFTAELLDAELVRHPPTRLRADSAMARREHWWWLPRRIVTLERVDAHRPLTCRRADTDGLLVTERPAGGVDVAVVDVAAEGSDLAQLSGLDGSAVRGAGEPALVMGHEYSVPDLGRWTTWRLAGQLRGDELEITHRTGSPGAASAPQRLRDRLRAERDVARGCRAALRQVRSG